MAERVGTDCLPEPTSTSPRARDRRPTVGRHSHSPLPGEFPRRLSGSRRRAPRTTQPTTPSTTRRYKTTTNVNRATRDTTPPPTAASNSIRGNSPPRPAAPPTRPHRRAPTRTTALSTTSSYKRLLHDTGHRLLHDTEHRLLHDTEHRLLHTEHRLLHDTEHRLLHDTELQRRTNVNCATRDTTLPPTAACTPRTLRHRHRDLHIIISRVRQALTHPARCGGAQDTTHTGGHSPFTLPPT